MSDVRLAEALDDSLALLKAGAPMSDCLARYPRLARELRPLLVAAVRLAEAAPGRLPDEARARAWRGIESATLPSEGPERLRAARGAWGRALLAPALAAAIILGLLFGFGTTQAPDVAESATLLTVLHGEVNVETSMGVVVVRGSMVLRPGDRVATSAGARAVLAFLDGSTVTLDADTVVSLRSAVENQGQVRVRLNQERGETWTYVSSSLGSAQIEIETPAAKLLTNQAAFSTRVERGGRTLVGAHAGAVHLASGNERASVTGGSSTTVESPGVVVPVVPVATPGRELTIRLGGAGLVYATDPAGASVGLAGPGLAMNQVAGASFSRGAAEAVLWLPEPREGVYRIVVHALGPGPMTLSVSMGLLAAPDSAMLVVRAGEDWSLTLTLWGDRPALGRPARLEPAAATSDLALPGQVLERVRATATAAAARVGATATATPSSPAPSPTALTATPTATTSSVPATPTPSPSPPVGATATPVPIASPAR